MVRTFKNQPPTPDDKEQSQTKKVINAQIDTKGWEKRFVYLTRQGHKIRIINKPNLRPLSAAFSWKTPLKRRIEGKNLLTDKFSD